MIERRAARGRDRPVRRPDAAAGSRAALEEAGVPLLGTPVDAIDLAEDRGRFGALLERARASRRPPYGDRRRAPRRRSRSPTTSAIPLLVRPSYVLGGRAMEICYSTERARGLPASAATSARTGASSSTASSRTRSRSTSTRSATARTSAIGGDHAARRGGRRPLGRLGLRAAAACRSAREMLDEIARRRRAASRSALGVVGLINVQSRSPAATLYVIEANPRASRTVPFVSKAIGAAAREDRLPADARRAARRPRTCRRAARRRTCRVKEAVLPFARFPAPTPVLGPEMRSTGEVMGIARRLPDRVRARRRPPRASRCPPTGTVFLTVTDADKPARDAARRALPRPRLRDRRHRAARRRRSRAMGIPVERLNKIGEGSPHVVDWIERGDVDLVINTPTGIAARARTATRSAAPRSRAASRASRR